VKGTLGAPIALALVTTMQWLNLRRRAPRSGWWFIAKVAALGVGSGGVLAVSALIGTPLVGASGGAVLGLGIGVTDWHGSRGASQRRALLYRWLWIVVALARYGREMMNTWVKSLTGTMTLSSIAFLAGLAQRMLVVRFLPLEYAGVLPRDQPGQVALGMPPLLAVYGGWVWALLAAARQPMGADRDVDV